MRKRKRKKRGKERGYYAGRRKWRNDFKECK